MTNRFEEQYRTGDMPWDHGLVDTNLIRTVEQFPIPPCTALDIGCGTGDNAIWLNKKGFTVTGIDYAETAIQMAQAKPDANQCTFRVLDFLSESIPGAPFDFAFDRGCFHSVQGDGAREGFPGRVADLLSEGGHWLTLIGNADELRRENGPPQMTALEITTRVEPHFELLALESGYMGSDQTNPPRAWICLMRKRA